MNAAQQNRAMFNDIAPSYDFLNHLLSLNIDKIWRRKAVKEVLSDNPATTLDIATGTADLAILLAEKSDKIKVTGIDMAENMLEIGQNKIDKHKLNDRITLTQGDALNLPFPESSFDAVTCAFGVRNLCNRQKGLEEMFRVTGKDGKTVILEFSLPQKAPFKQLYNLYFNKILPKIGKLFSKNKTAYTYLPNSVNTFPTPDEFCAMMQKAGFADVRKKKLSLGIATLYIGVKKSD